MLNTIPVRYGQVVANLWQWRGTGSLLLVYWFLVYRFVRQYVYFTPLEMNIS
jgi:hypothetical protein